MRGMSILPKYDLRSPVSRQGHYWASTGFIRSVLNFIDQTPFVVLLVISFLIGVGLSLLVKALCR